MQAVADLRAAQFAQITVEVFNQMRDIGALHICQRSRKCFVMVMRMIVIVSVAMVVPVLMIVTVVMVVVQQSGLQIRIQVGLLDQFPYLLLQQRQLGRI
jgi:hypothetical protein